MKPISLTAAVGLLLMTSLPSHATLSRAWVSGHGTDQTSCGPVASPCRTLQYVHDTIISAGGEIDVLDSAGYGPIAISKALSVVNDGNVAGVLASGSGNGVTINAGSGDNIVLRGLTIEGGGTGTDGVHFSAGATLLVENCSISDFSYTGIDFAPQASAELQVSATTIRNTYAAAAYVNPTLQSTGAVLASFDHVTTFNTGNGFFIDGRTISATATVHASISNSSTAYNINRGNGIYGQGVVATASNTGGMTTAVVGSTTIANSNVGLVRNTNSQSLLYIGRSILTGNATAVSTTGIFSFGDNYIAGNTSSGSALTAIAPQ